MDNLLLQVLLLAVVVACIEFIVPAGDAASRFSPRRALQALLIVLFALWKLGFVSSAGLNRHASAPLHARPAAARSV